MSSIWRIMLSGSTPFVPGWSTTTGARSLATYFFSLPMKAPGNRDTAASTRVPGMTSFRVVRAPSITESPIALTVPLALAGAAEGDGAGEVLAGMVSGSSRATSVGPPSAMPMACATSGARPSAEEGGGAEATGPDDDDAGHDRGDGDPAVS